MPMCTLKQFLLSVIMLIKLSTHEEIPSYCAFSVSDGGQKYTVNLRLQQSELDNSNECLPLLFNMKIPFLCYCLSTAAQKEEILS